MKHTKNLAMSIIPLSLMAILLFAVLGSKAQAYTFTSDFKNGYYWRTFPIKMTKFASADDSVELEELANEAVEDWEAAIGKDIWEMSAVQNSTSYSGNYIRWSDNFGAETGYDPTRTLAITIRYNQGTYFQQTVIILNGNISYLRQNWGNSLKATILHEIGHTIGLDHSEDTTAIMAASLGSTSDLQSDDVAGANAVVDETLKRQSSGYTSPLSTQSEKKAAACGTVEDISKNSNGSGGAMANFLGSLLVGLMLMALIGRIEKTKRQKILVRY